MHDHLMTKSALTPETAAWRSLWRTTAITGLTTVVLAFVVLVGSRPEPSFDAPAAEFLTHYRSPNTVGSPLRSFGLALSLIYTEPRPEDKIREMAG